MSIVLDRNGNPVDAGEIASELIFLREQVTELQAELSARTLTENDLRAQVAALTKERDHAVNIIEQTLNGISFGELRKAYAAYRAGEKYETVVDRVMDELAAAQAHVERLRKALEYVAPMYNDVDIVCEGEVNAGIIMEDGRPHHWVILLPGDHDATQWQAAVDWAKSLNGELPSRDEQSLLFANLKDAFRPTWYWSGEQYASDASFAWYQSFITGDQYCDHVSLQFRARAVRRVKIK